jgi:hypothetical protein
MNTVFDDRRVLASLNACKNIPIHALENEKCLIERMMDVLASNGWARRHSKNEDLPAPPSRPELTPELIAQVEQLEANATKYFDLYQGQLETNGQLKMEIAQLKAEVERLKRK